MAFTFLNATGAPALSPSDAKLMRAHITRTNFANRRQRLMRKTTGAREKKPNNTQKTASADPPLETPPPSSSEARYVQILSQFWSQAMSPADPESPFPHTRGEAAFMRLIVSDPALAEVSLAIGLRHWSPATGFQHEAAARAAARSARAVGLVVRRLGGSEETACADAVVATVLSMAVGERLALDDDVWRVHVGGLADIIAHRRRARAGARDLPPFLIDFLILDSTNHVFDFPLVYHRRVVDAIRAYGSSQPICAVDDMSEGLVRLRKLMDAGPQSAPDPDDDDAAAAARTRDIEAARTSLLAQSRALLHDSTNPYVQATALATQLILHLLVRSAEGTTATTDSDFLTQLAGELKTALSRLPVRPCLFMDLTSCQVMLGAVAAGPGSEERAWFVARLRAAASTLRGRGWQRPFEVMERGGLGGGGGASGGGWAALVGRFRELWRELDG